MAHALEENCKIKEALQTAGEAGRLAAQFLENRHNHRTPPCSEIDNLLSYYSLVFCPEMQEKENDQIELEPLQQEGHA